jgi:hypothetical protein
MTTPEVKRVVKRLDELAQSMPPPRDLWPAIAQAIEAEARKREAKSGSSAPQSLRRRAWWMPVVGMAAAVALVSIGVIIGSRIETAPTITAANPQPGNPEVIDASLRDANYRKQREALLTEVNNRLQTMPAAEREKVAGSLKTLQRSIGEIEAALGKDPANALLQELLVNSCQEEMRALTAVRDSGSQEI